MPAEDMDAAVRPILPLSLVAVHGLPPGPFERLWRRWQLQSLLQQCLHLQQNTRAAAATIRDSPPSSPRGAGTRARVRAHCDSLRGSPPALPLRFRSVHPRALIAVRPGRGRGVDTGLARRYTTPAPAWWGRSAAERHAADARAGVAGGWGSGRRALEREWGAAARRRRRRHRGAADAQDGQPLARRRHVTSAMQSASSRTCPCCPRCGRSIH